MKKFNWGWGITLLYLSFVSLMLFMVWKTSFVKDDLVTKDYYAEELKFQDRIDKVTRTKALGEPLQWVVKDKTISLNFPLKLKGQSIGGKILFYCPGDDRKDFSMNISTNGDGVCSITADKLEHGVYQMQIEWKAGTTEYFDEGYITIP